jgi:hypothetical protein
LYYAKEHGRNRIVTHTDMKEELAGSEG